MSYANINHELRRPYQPNVHLAGPLGGDSSGPGLGTALVVGAIGFGIWWFVTQPSASSRKKPSRSKSSRSLSAAEIRRIKSDSDRRAKEYTDQWKRDNPELARKHA